MQEGNNSISLRLDRAFATPEWVEMLRGLKVHHIANSTSDHHALLVTVSITKCFANAKHFHLEAMCMKNNDCKAIIESSGGMETDLSTSKGVMENLKRCAADLMTWSS